MSRMAEVKVYAEHIAMDCHSYSQIANATAARYGLTQDEKRLLLQHVRKTVSFKCDRTLCGRASLMSARLPLNRIAEVFV
jgi:hypothetical protein